MIDRGSCFAVSAVRPKERMKAWFEIRIYWNGVDKLKRVDNPLQLKQFIVVDSRLSKNANPSTLGIEDLIVYPNQRLRYVRVIRSRNRSRRTIHQCARL